MVPEKRTGARKTVKKKKNIINKMQPQTYHCDNPYIFSFFVGYFSLLLFFCLYNPKEDYSKRVLKLLKNIKPGGVLPWECNVYPSSICTNVYSILDIDENTIVSDEIPKKEEIEDAFNDLVANCKADLSVMVVHDIDEPFGWSIDEKNRIHLAHQSSFESYEMYLNFYFHQLGHFVERARGLSEDRDIAQTHNYSLEELTVEHFTMMCCTYCNIPSTILSKFKGDDHAETWRECLEENPKWVSIAYDRAYEHFKWIFDEEPMKFYYSTLNR